MADARRLPRTSALGRGAVTGLAVARAGVAQIGHRVRQQLPASESQRRQAQADHEAAVGRLLFSALSQLRGTALKVSQLLSMDTGLLPAGVRQELARACHQVLPLNRALVGRVFRQAFGQEPEQLFEHFEPQAFAAASLGQVHRAELPGHGAVAVKVQYPGIAATIPADMRLLRTALQALGHGGLALPEPAVVERLMHEVEATLLRELDYRQEAEQLAWFAEHACTEGIVIPRPIASHSSATVLTQQRLEGLHLEAWLATDPSPAQRDQVGQRLYDWFMHCAFTLGRVQSDLHPGNFLFLPDGRLGVLDFGCTRTLSPAFRHGLLRTWAAWLAPASAERIDTLWQVYLDLGLLRDTVTRDQFEREVLPHLGTLLNWQTEALRAPHFDFARKQPPPPHDGEEHRQLVRHMAGAPDELPAFERAWFGLMHLLQHIGARVHTHRPLPDAHPGAPA